MKTLVYLSGLASAAALCLAQGTPTTPVPPSTAPSPTTYSVPSLDLETKHRQMLTLAAAVIAVGFADARAHGMTIDDYAKFCGDQFAPNWPKQAGFDGFAKGVLLNFEIWRQEGDPAIEILAQNDSMLKFKAYNSWRHAFNDGELMGLTLAQFYRWCDGISQRIATHMGCQYTQQIDGDYMIITLTKPST